MRVIICVTQIPDFDFLKGKLLNLLCVEKF